MSEVREAVAAAHRAEWALVLAATARACRDLDLAEECAQEAYLRALSAWERDGIPRRPGAWLTTTARNLALDALRREGTLRRKLPLLVEDAASEPGAGRDAWSGEQAPPGDDRLRLVFTCCHPALAPDARVALTLRLVCGVPTADVARAFLVSEATMAARITRAKKKITDARIPYRVPARADLPERLDSVLTAVHLLYTTGHTASGDGLSDDDLCLRALDLADTLARLLPAEPEVFGLLGLLLLTHARRAARLDDAGRLVLLEDADRSRWDAVMISNGLLATAAALTRTRTHGRFALQAAIAGVHAAAPAFAQTDWARVVHLYDLLLVTWDSPVVALNRAAALAFRDGPDAGLAALDALDGDRRLDGYPWLAAARAELLRRAGRPDQARGEYERALALGVNDVEREHLRARLALLEQH